MRMAPSRRLPKGDSAPGSVGAEIDDEDFPGLGGGRFPLASADGILGGLGEDGMSTDDGGGVHGAVGSDDGFDADRSGDSHAAGETRVDGLGLGDQFALALRLILLPERR